MGIITVSINDEVEEKFREKLGKEDREKGSMGRAVSEALRDWIKKDEENSGRPRWLKIAEEEVELGEIDFDRDELHER